MTRSILIYMFFSILPLYAPNDPYYVIAQWGLIAEYSHKIDVEIEALIEEGRELLNAMDFPTQIMIGESSVLSTLDKIKIDIKEKKYLRDQKIRTTQDIIVKYPHLRKYFLSIEEEG